MWTLFKTKGVKAGWLAMVAGLLLGGCATKPVFVQHEIGAGQAVFERPAREIARNCKWQPPLRGFRYVRDGAQENDCKHYARDLARCMHSAGVNVRCASVEWRGGSTRVVYYPDGKGKYLCEHQGNPIDCETLRKRQIVNCESV